MGPFAYRSSESGSRSEALVARFERAFGKLRYCADMVSVDRLPEQRAARGRQLAACIFCGDPDITQEHLVADWAIRAFTRQRKPFLLAAHLPVAGESARVGSAAPTLAAGVTCRECNNGWISTLDREASTFLKPIIRGSTVTMSPSQQAIAGRMDLQDCADLRRSRPWHERTAG